MPKIKLQLLKNNKRIRRFQRPLIILNQLAKRIRIDRETDIFEMIYLQNHR